MTNRGSPTDPDATMARCLMAQGVEADVEAHGIDETAAIGSGDEVGGCCRVEREGLLADHVLPGFEGRPHLWRMEVVGRGDVHDIDRRIGEQRREVVVDPRQVGRFGLRCREPLSARSDDTDDVDAEPTQRLHVGNANEADSDDSCLDVS